MVIPLDAANQRVFPLAVVEEPTRHGYEQALDAGGSTSAVTDGLSNTLFLGEVGSDFVPWGGGTRPTCGPRPTASIVAVRRSVLKTARQCSRLVMAQYAACRIELIRKIKKTRVTGGWGRDSRAVECRARRLTSEVGQRVPAIRQQPGCGVGRRFGRHESHV